jgi:hypothetical protein
VYALLQMHSRVALMSCPVEESLNSGVIDSTVKPRLPQPAADWQFSSTARSLRMA